MKNSLFIKKPYLGWTKDQAILNAQRDWYGVSYKKWYNVLFRYLKLNKIVMKIYKFIKNNWMWVIIFTLMFVFSHKV